MEETLGGAKTINGLVVMKAGVGSPVGHQGVLLPPEHDAHISGMVFGGVEISVVAWVENHVGMCVKERSQEVRECVFVQNISLGGTTSTARFRLFSSTP